MEKNFDDYYNEFFGDKKPNDSTNNEKFKNISNIIESLSSIKVNKDYESLEGDVSKDLIPNKVENFIKDDLSIKKMTWETPRGKFVKLIVSDLDTAKLDTPKKSLQEQLNEAVKNEDYELAVKLRDEIKSKK